MQVELCSPSLLLLGESRNMEQKETRTHIGQCKNSNLSTVTIETEKRGIWGSRAPAALNVTGLKVTITDFRFICTIGLAYCAFVVFGQLHPIQRSTRIVTRGDKIEASTIISKRENCRVSKDNGDSVCCVRSCGKDTYPKLVRW